ncbi:hypothetical protein GGP81_002080 [Salinibacter ruber]|uniref:DUF2971 domain-containing protein n=1 Tax=Salinibacter ruber TaxID=146919 RepID=UPI002169708B|nr:DUF2971 domain-containing protein [Salinibacter ruber]MCS3955549.1 hypothetical protein [Salinibacter ruber]
MLIYKYAPPERIDALQNELIRFTQPSSFNDPFETLPYLQSLVTPGRGEDIAEQVVEEILEPVKEGKIGLAELLEIITESDSEEEPADGLVVTREDRELMSRFTRVLKWMVETRDVNEAEIVTDFLENTDFASKFGDLLNLDVSEEDSEEDSVFAEMRERTRRLQNLLQTAFQAVYNDRYGILSLSQRRKSLLMWSHYSEAHSGFLMAFDSEHAFFQSARSSEESDSYFGPVEYSATRPSLPLKMDQMVTPAIDERVQRMVEEGTFSFNQESESVDGLEKKLEERARNFLFTKSDHWRYEGEWRLVRPLSHHDELNDEIYLFEWPPSALRAIVAGCKMDDNVQDEIEDLLQKDRYSHVDLYEARTSREEFGLEYEPVEV